mgnify:CR=1 FL=1
MLYKTSYTSEESEDSNNNEKKKSVRVEILDTTSININDVSTYNNFNLIIYYLEYVSLFFVTLFYF